ncbi:MFS transporter [Paenibacillus sp.]|jgi:CP family cyanate transporter-like MFS transporter|uniref:CynX/NimT family MFS transporter n=1 Tax=Paenibacillus sp. TaxID=58172 RepID=UPI00282F73A7|nr:MFS transporter [Paenibacillus sp.]MDR0267721.1 MFS transporter [Paenibacillus sp.]
MNSGTQVKNETENVSVSTGLKAVILILGIIMVATTLRSPITAVGPLIETIRSDTGMSHTLAGLLTTFPLLAFALMSPLAPRIARKWGMERALFAGIITVTAGITLRFIPSLAALFTGTIILGLGIAVGNVLLPSLIKRDFPLRVGVMTGIYSVSMNVFAAIASGVSVPVTRHLSSGWRGALLMWGISSLVALIVWLPQLRYRHQTENVQISSKSNVWCSKLAWQVTIVMGLQSFVFYSVVAWLPEILSGRGMSAGTAGWMLSLMQLFSVPATFFVPVLAARFNNQRGLVTATFLCFVLGFVSLLTDINALIPLSVILIGIGTGAAFGLVTMFFMLRTRHTHQAAELSGMAQSIGYLLAAVGPFLIGFVHDLTGSWSAAIGLLILVSVIYLLTGLGAGSNRYIGEEHQKTSVN